MIGQLAAKTWLSVRTLRFYADAGILPVAGRTASGYRDLGPEAVARARLVRTLRELGVGLDDIKRVLSAEVSLVDAAAEQVAAWVELAQLLRDPDFVAVSRLMAERARAEGSEPDVARFDAGEAVGELAGPA